MAQLKRIKEAIGGFLIGLASKEVIQHTARRRGQTGRLLILLVTGEVLGIPFPRSYYALRPLPYLFPRLDVWKRTILRERDLIDALQ